MPESPPQAPCPEEHLLALAARGALSPEDSARVHAHSASCPTCRVKLTEGAPSTEDLPTAIVSGPAPLPTSEPLETLVRGAVMGRYMVLERLGSGGMGVVYAAYDPELDRKVAIKLLQAGTPDVERSGGQMRLLREAQAMARLSHPNVIAVYDVGTWGERVFVAMELVEGSNLREWLKAAPRGWREIVEVFLAAGRGLAAAHAAGLIHRDFKPDNVLLGQDGRVRVLDFGLARSAGELPGPARPLPLPPEETSTSSGSPLSTPLSTPLTQVGQLIGTVAYMAPEQRLGQSFDARSDEFSFCVALYEALYGKRPFPAHVPPEKWRVPEPPRDSLVPPAVRRVVLRGLHRDPGERFPSMDALLEALGDTVRVRQRRWLAGVGLLALALGVGLPLSFQDSAESLCRGAPRRLEGIWNKPRQQALEKAFLATGRPQAADVWARSRDVLDTYASAWAAMHTEACEATRVRGEQSDEVLSLRMACLDRRLQSLAALTHVYAQADAALLEQAAKAAHALPPLADCADVEALRAPVRPPRDAATQQRVEALRTRLAQAQARFDSGQYMPALEVAREVAAEALTLQYRPLEAEALELRGVLEEKAGELKTAEATLAQALRAAVAGRHDTVAAFAAARLVRVAMLQAQFERGREWAEYTRASLERLGGNARIEAYYLNALGAIHLRQGQGPEGLAQFQRVLELRRSVYPAEHPDIAAALNNVGAAMLALGRTEEGRQHLEQAQALYEKTLGPHHSETANALYNLGRMANDVADDARALDYRQRALTARETNLGPEHPDVASSLESVGVTLCSLGRFDEALPLFERAQAIREKAFGPEHSDVALSIYNQGLALHGLGRYAEALTFLQRTRAMEEKTLGADSPDMAETLVDLATTLRALGRHAEALPLYEQALTLARKGESDFSMARALEGLGGWQLEQGKASAALASYQQAIQHREASVALPEHPDLVGALAGLGRSHVELRAPREALAPLERALKLSASPRVAPRVAANLRFDLARALWETNGDRERARQLATEARDIYTRAGREQDVRAVNAWLAAR